MHRRARYLKSKSLGATAAWDSRLISGASNGSAMSSWSDTSGNGYDATQATSANQPVYTTNVFGGQPSVRFDGSNDQLIHTANPPDPCVIFAAVQKLSSQTAYRGICAFGDNNSTGTLMLYQVNAGNWGTYTTTDATANTAFATDSPSIVTMVDNGASGGSFYFNSKSDGTWTGNAVGQAQKHIGGQTTQQSNMDFGSVILTSSVSDSLRKRIEHSLGFSFKISCS